MLVLQLAQLNVGVTAAFAPIEIGSDGQTSMARSRVQATVRLYDKKKNFADEILDALDVMLGVSPFDETDLKEQNVNLERAQMRREAQAPPTDSLSKPSVSIFFALLAIIPALISINALQNGLKPFGLE